MFNLDEIDICISIEFVIVIEIDIFYLPRLALGIVTGNPFVECNGTKDYLTLFLFYFIGVR